MNAEIIKANILIECSLASGGSGVVSLILPPGVYNDAVSFYTDELGLSLINFDSQLMKSETFEGDINEWHISVQVAQTKSGGNDPMVSITVDVS